jgi:hypothetical protein
MGESGWGLLCIHDLGEVTRNIKGQMVKYELARLAVSRSFPTS